MADPTKYTPDYDFSDYQASSPSDPLPGNQVDAELDAISNSIDGIVDAVKDIRRSDGALKNGIVTIESLSGDFDFAMPSVSDWLTATTYALRDYVWSGGSLYQCIVAHTSGTFATDLAAAKWVIRLDFTSASVAANAVVDTAVTAAADAVAAAATATAALDSFDDKYLGAKAANPTLDNDGNALTTGSLYWNTVSSQMLAYTGSTWSTVTTGNTTADIFSGNGATTAFGLSVTPGTAANVAVHISGVRQRPITDYTLSGATVTFTSAPPSGTNNILCVSGVTLAVGIPSDGSVNTVKIEDSAVTDAKLANMPTNTVKVNATGSTAVPTNLTMAAGTILARLASGNIVAATVSQIKTLLGLTESDITLADNTTNNASTSKHGFLKKLSNSSTEFMDGTGNWATPAGGATVLISTATASASSTLDFSSLDTSTYRAFIFIIDQLVCGTSSANLRARFSTAGSFVTANSSYRWGNGAVQIGGTTETITADGGTAATQAYIELMSTAVGAAPTYSGRAELFAPASTANLGSPLIFNGSYYDTGGTQKIIRSGYGVRLSTAFPTAAIDGVRFYPSAGTFTSGSIKCYGIKN